MGPIKNWGLNPGDHKDPSSFCFLKDSSRVIHLVNSGKSLVGDRGTLLRKRGSIHCKLYSRHGYIKNTTHLTLNKNQQVDRFLNLF